MITCLNQSKPGAFDNLYMKDYFIFDYSVIESYFKHSDYLKLFNTQRPAETKECWFGRYPRCGEPKLIYPSIMLLKSSKNGNAALIITPPREWPTKDNLFRKSTV